MTLLHDSPAADLAPPPDRRSAWTKALLASGLAANLFVIVTVNFWIYRARALYIAAHPDKVATKPPTISGAIADPAIGEPFSWWITLSAVFLAFGVATFAWHYLRTGKIHLRTRLLQVGMVGLSLSLALTQVAAAYGMYMLSSFRFPHHIELHMAGSFLFFGAQTVVILIFALISALLLGGTKDRQDAPFRWSVVRLRMWLGFGCVALALVYSLLFIVKNLETGLPLDLVYGAYVLIEPTLISGYLVVLMLCLPDLWDALRGARPAIGRNAPVQTSAP